MGPAHAVNTLRCLSRSFGVVLLEIVTGIMPVTRGRVPPPEVPAQCPADIWDLIQRCMVSEPGLRPTAKVRQSHERCEASTWVVGGSPHAFMRNSRGGTDDRDTQSNNTVL
jgi:hypothetical protein